jgi:anti-anti-sigma factor
MRSTLMDVNTSTLHGVPLLVLAGEIGHESCPELRRTIEGMLHEGVDRLLLDFSKVEYIDSGCIGLMWALFRSVASHGWMGVIGATADIRRILSVVGFVEDGTFRLFAARADAELALTA